MRCRDQLVRFCVKFHHGDWLRLARDWDRDYFQFHLQAIDLWLEHGGEEMITKCREEAARSEKTSKGGGGGKRKKPNLKVVT